MVAVAGKLGPPPIRHCIADWPKWSALSKQHPCQSCRRTRRHDAIQLLANSGQRTCLVQGTIIQQPRLTMLHAWWCRYILPQDGVLARSILRIRDDAFGWTRSRSVEGDRDREGSQVFEDCEEADCAGIKNNQTTSGATNFRLSGRSSLRRIGISTGALIPSCTALPLTLMTVTVIPPPITMDSPFFLDKTSIFAPLSAEIA